MKKPLILLVEDNLTTLKLFRITLQTEGYQVIDCANAAAALAAADDSLPALVLQDIVLPDLDGFELARRLRALPGGNEMPLVAVTGLLSRAEEARLGGAFDEVLLKPVEPSQLIEVVHRYLGGTAPDSQLAAPRRILLVDDDPVQLKLTRLRLERAGFTVSTATDGIDALVQARREVPDAVLSDVMMPRADGFVLCQLLRRDPDLAHVPVVLVSAYYCEDEDRDLARRVGANCLVERTPDLLEAEQALLRCLETGAPPPPPAEPGALQQEHIERLMRQLERQAVFNQGLTQRCALQGAALAVVRRLSDVLGRETRIDTALEDVLYTLLDISSGQAAALYFAGGDGVLALAACVGLEEDEARDALGHHRLMTRALEEDFVSLTGHVEGRELLTRIGARSGVIVPLVARGERLGVLLLSYQTREELDADRIELSRAVGVQIAHAVALQRSFQAVATSQEYYRTLFESANDAISVLTPEGVLLDVNRRSVELLGGRREDYVGRAITDFAAPGSEASNLAAFKTVLAGAAERTPPVPMRRFDGGTVFVEFTVQPAKVDGKTVVFSIGRDVTQSLEMSRRLRESEERYRSLVEHSPDVVWTLAEDRQTIGFISRNVARICGYTSAELTQGGAELWLERVQPEDQGRVRAALRALYEGSAPYDIEYRWQRQDGEWIWIHGRGLATAMDGGAERIHGVFSDVTARRHLEQRLGQAQKMEAIGRLTGGVAHDFNNLLAAILANAHFLLEDLGEDDARRTDAREILRGAERAATLTRQLLAFSRGQVLQPRVIDLNDVVGGVEPMLRRLIGEDVALEIHPSPELEAVRADAGQVEQVLVNLAVNARDAMPTGGRLVIETANVELGADYVGDHEPARPGRYVMVAVSDTGCGMSAATQRRLFEPFFTTKHRGGTGLGLSTCYGIVKQSGGYIWVYSEQGHGTTFKIYLPRVDARPEPLPIPAAATRGGTETILVVEDDPHVRAAVERILVARGYTVLAAGDGEEALALAKSPRRPIDMVLSDMVLPGASGPDVMARLHALARRARPLFMSGYTDHVLLRGGAFQGGINYIQKPFSPDVLARKVREVLDA